MPVVLPAWEVGTVALLPTAGSPPAPPHVIPVSTVLRAADDALLLALGLRRGSLARLRERPRVAVSLLACDVACTAHGVATVVEEPLRESGRVAAVRVAVLDLQDHRRDDFALHGPVAWAWTDEAAARRDAEVRTGLRRLAGM